MFIPPQIRKDIPAEEVNCGVHFDKDGNFELFFATSPDTANDNGPAAPSTSVNVARMRAICALLVSQQVFDAVVNLADDLEIPHG